MRHLPCLAMLSASAFVVVPAAVGGETCTWLGRTSSWCDAQNWSCGHVPGDEDDAVIPSDAPAKSSEPEVDCDTTINSLTVSAGRTVVFAGPYSLTIDDGTLHVKAGGTIDIDRDFAIIEAQGADALDIDGGMAGMFSSPGSIRVSASGAALRLSGASNTGHRIDGEVLLQAAAGVLDIAADVKVIGSGMIHGSDASAQIVIANGRTFTNTMCAVNGGIRGFMRIGGSGSFANDGLVLAGSGGTFELASTLSGVSGSGEWQVASSGTRRLLFSASATSLTGEFILAGELELAQDVCTCGQLTFDTGALIDVETAGRTFKYLSFNGDSDCSNPKDSGGGTDCATDPYVVSENKLCN